jgi:hypothetical protein
MKKQLLTFLIGTLCTTAFVHAQIIRNGDMEHWKTDQVEDPDGWKTANKEKANQGGLKTVSKSADSRSGSAIRLETKVSDKGDTMFGYFTNTQGDPLNGEGGSPYSQQPQNITGYYKGNIAPGDSAIVIVLFKKAGNIISMTVGKLYGNHTAYTPFSFPIDNLLMQPDSVIIAAASSNAFDGVGIQPGSFILFDDLAFSGTGITQQLAGSNFDNWHTEEFISLNDWFSFGEGITRSTDHYKGEYGLLLETKRGENGDVYPSGISNRDFNGMTQSGGMPYSNTNDTLVFYYKYIPAGEDTAMAYISLFNNGSIVGGYTARLTSAATYTKAEIPLPTNMAPDTIQFMFVSSANNNGGPVTTEGSKFWIDEIQFASDPLQTGVSSVFKNNTAVSVYPNPFVDYVVINASADYSQLTYTVNDVTGKVLIAGTGNKIETSALGLGIYFIAVKNGPQTVCIKKIIKQ